MLNNEILLSINALFQTACNLTEVWSIHIFESTVRTSLSGIN